MNSYHSLDLCLLQAKGFIFKLPAAIRHFILPSYPFSSVLPTISANTYSPLEGAVIAQYRERIVIKLNPKYMCKHNVEIIINLANLLHSVCRFMHGHGRGRNVNRLED